MAHAYTPGLTVTGRTSLTKRRALPLAGEVCVQKGQLVRADTVLARAELPGDVHPVNVVNLLGIDPRRIREYMLKKEGDQVEKDEPIARTNPWIKLFRTVCRSPVHGSVESISEITGQVMLREPPRRVELAAYVDGTVTEVYPTTGVAVRTEAALVQGIFGVGGECFGALKVPVESGSSQLDARILDSHCENCIIVCGSAVDSRMVEAARQAGVRALIAGGIAAVELRRIVGYEIGVAVTGSEDIGLTIVLTDGIGRIPMAENTFRLLKALDGRRASVNGATQIRAGVLRPEIIVPVDEDFVPPIEHEASGHADGLWEGDQVRIIREPYFGFIGTVVELVPEVHEIETEAKVRVLRVRAKEGEVVTVPRANVEIIKG